MPRPCKHAFPSLPCHFCKLWLTRADYRALWGGPATLGKVQQHLAKQVVPCVHLGEATGRVVDCASCGQRNGKAVVHRCDLKGECTTDRVSKEYGLACCRYCLDRSIERPLDEMPEIRTRNLLYHVCPFPGNGVWQRNVEQIRKRMSLFNGRRAVAIVTGPGLEHPDAVRRAFGDDVGDYLILPNDPKLREAKTLVPLLERVQTTDPREVTFFGHTKGVTRPVNPGVTVHRWADLMYESCLDDWEAVAKVLSSHVSAGSFLKVGSGFQGSASRWHYSGTFWWVRNSTLFSRDWRKIDQQWWGAESYLSLHVRQEEAGCLFHRGKVPTLDLYSFEYMRDVVEPEWEKWNARKVAMV